MRSILHLVGIASLASVICASSAQSYTVDDIIMDVLAVKCYIRDANKAVTSDAERIKLQMEVRLLNDELVGMYGSDIVRQASQYIAFEYAEDALFAEACASLE